MKMREFVEEIVQLQRRIIINRAIADCDTTLEHGARLQRVVARNVFKFLLPKEDTRGIEEFLDQVMEASRQGVILARSSLEKELQNPRPFWRYRLTLESLR